MVLVIGWAYVRFGGVAWMQAVFYGRSQALAARQPRNLLYAKKLGHFYGIALAANVPRRDPITETGMTIPPAMGSANAINFQPTSAGKAVITGDFVITGDEVNPMIKALRANGIEVTAIHSHMLAEQPRVFFVHFWANDDAVRLAKGLRAALDKTAATKN